MGLELAWWMRIHRHVLRFPVVWIEVKEIRNYGALPFPPALSNSIFVRNLIPEIQDFFWLIVVQKTSELPAFLIFMFYHLWLFYFASHVHKPPGFHLFPMGLQTPPLLEAQAVSAF